MALHDEKAPRSALVSASGFTFVSVSERGSPFAMAGFARRIERHACGYRVVT
jgi:hypothetical protein